MKILLSCVGNRDPEAKDPSTGEITEGAVVTSIRFLKPDIVCLLPTKKTKKGGIDTIENAERCIEYIKDKIKEKIAVFCYPLEIDDPTDYQRLSDSMLPNLSGVKVEWEENSPEYHISISSGTAQMQAVWLMIHTISLVDAKLWQVIEPRFADGDKPELRTRQVKQSDILKKYLVDPLRGQIRHISANLANLQGSHFEDEVEDYLRRKFNYTEVEKRYTPPFLKGKEVDVYAKRSGFGERHVSLCECKLRLNPKPITREEIKNFAQKVYSARRHEEEIAKNQGENLSFYAVFVTNYGEVEETAKELAKNEKIDLHEAKIPRNWRNCGDWKINKMTRII